MRADPTTRMQDSSTPSRSLALVIVCGCLISLLTFGLRSSFGLFTDPLSMGRGWSREVFALAMAIQSIVWGLSQPIAGGLADRYGPAPVLAGGGMLYALGMALMALSTTPTTLHLTGGVLVGLGMGGASFVTVLAALGRLVSDEARSWVLGIATAAGSLGQFLIVPLGQAFISAYGWVTALFLLSCLAAMVPFLATAVKANGSPAGASGPALSLGEALQQACGHTSYLLLTAGFFVCGFQLAFISVHLPPYLTDAGMSASLAAWSIGLIGLFNVVGAYAAGALGSRRSKKRLLSGIYFGRALATVAFLVLPITPLTVLTFAAAMGIFWLSTAPLTSGLVAVMFGTRYMATLFGIVFFSHQLGASLGVWLGGLFFARTGSYHGVWWLVVMLGVAAGVLNLLIAERQAPRALAAAG